MFRPLFALFTLLALSPLALACNCRSGGSCDCGDCSCSAKSDTSSPTPNLMAAPLADLVAAALDTPSTVQVGVANFSFSTNVTIHVGDTVEWTWNGGTHSVTSVAGSADPFASLTQSSGTFSHLFTIPGVYNYYCVIHGHDNGNGTASGMSATVTVLPLPEPTTFALASASLLLTRRPKRPL